MGTRRSLAGSFVGVLFEWNEFTQTSIFASFFAMKKEEENPKTKSKIKLLASLG